MSVTHIEYDISTGDILSENISPTREFRLPEGPHPHDPTRGILHASTKGKPCRVEHGKLVPIGLAKRRKDEKAMGWFDLRQRRNAYFAKIKHKESRFYPLTEAEEAELNTKMAESRDLPQTFTDPAAAIARLDEIWSGEDVE